MPLSTSNAPNVPVDSDTSNLISKSVNFCLIKLEVESTPSLINPFVVFPPALVSTAATSSTDLPFPDHATCAIPSISKSIDADPIEQLVSL